MGTCGGNPETDDILREKHCKKHSDSLNKYQSKRIIEQMDQSVCKMMDNHGTGFICMIPYPNDFNLLPVLISCNHVLQNEDVEPGKKINLKFEDKEILLEIDKDRKVYKSLKDDYDCTIIELRKTDGFDFKHFLHVDENIFSDNLKEAYKNNEIVYVIHYPKLDEIQKSVDSINFFSKHKITHFCSTDHGSSGSPILNLDTFKVIGIHSGNFEINGKSVYNVGTIIKFPIQEFIKKYPPKIKKNEILLKLYAWEKDINKKIYFLDNGSFEKGEDKEDSHNNLKELNENNTKIYINNIEYKYCKYFKPEKVGLYEIRIEINIPIKDCSYMFSCCKNIVDFDFSSFNTRSVTDMSYMFSSCQNIRELDLSSFDTNNVTNMNNMFSFCIGLMSIDLSSFFTNKVTNMSKMFNWCPNLRTINVGNFDISKVENMDDMFNTCEKLVYIDLSSFIAKKATSVSRMFRGCEALQNIKFFEFDGENITNMEEMFLGCYSLVYINLESFNTRNVTNMHYMFYGCQNLKLINFSNFNTKNVIDMSGMFFACTNITELNLMSFDTKKVENMSKMFSMCRSLQNLYFGYLDLTNTKKIDGIFKNCLNLKLLVVPKEMNAKLKYELDNRYVEPLRFKSGDQTIELYT